MSKWADWNCNAYRFAMYGDMRKIAVFVGACAVVLEALVIGGLVGWVAMTSARPGGDDLCASIVLGLFLFVVGVVCVSIPMTSAICFAIWLLRKTVGAAAESTTRSN